MSSQIDNYMKCRVYNNVQKEVGINDLSNISLYDFATDDAPIIIVKKNPLNKYHLREILTGVSFDTIYTVFPEESYSSPYLVGIPFKKYSSFIKSVGCLDYEYLEKYINEHKDVEAYRQYLLTLKTEALERCKKEAINERKTLLEENYKVKRLIKEAKGKKRKKN